MKNKVLFAAVLAGSLTLACSTAVVANDDCGDLSKMKLRVGEYYLELDDKKVICVPVPSEFSITVKGKSGYKIEKDTISVAKKAKQSDPGAKDVTVTGDNKKDAKELKIKVGGKTEKENVTVAFLIDVDDVGILDPKIKIIDTGIYIQYQEDELYRLASQLGANIETLTLGDPTWQDDNK